MAKIALGINRVTLTVDVELDTPLLGVVRDALGLTGAAARAAAPAPDGV